MKKQWYQLMGVAVILVTMFTGFSVTAWAQSQARQKVYQQWVNLWGGPYIDWAWDMVIDGSGNAYVTGQSGYNTGANYATIKINSAGVLQWANFYDGDQHGQDVAKAIARDEEGYIYVTGWSRHTGPADNYNWVTLRIDPDDGATIAIAEYDGPYTDEYPTDYAHDLIAKGGYVYVTGCAKVAGGFTDYCTIKYYSDLSDSAWVRFYDGGGQGDVAQALTVDASGNVYVTGYSVGNDEDYATVKYNANGVQQWAARYNGTGNGPDRANSITVRNGDVYVTGYSDSLPSAGANLDWATIKYNANGVQQWVNRKNGTGNGEDKATALAVDASGNAYVTGYCYRSHGSSGANFDYVTVKYNASGLSIWPVADVYYNGPGNGEDKALAIALDGGGNPYVTGYSLGNVSSFDYATIKYSSVNGQQQWLIRYNGTGIASETATAIAVGTGPLWAPYVYVTGYTGDNNASQFATVKYRQLNDVTIPQTDGEDLAEIWRPADQAAVPEQYSLEQNCPNPFNPTTTISYALPQASWVNLAVYDVSGRQVAELVNDWREGGNHEAIFDGSKLTSGLYLYTLKAGTYSACGKMVLVK